MKSLWKTFEKFFTKWKMWPHNLIPRLLLIQKKWRKKLWKDLYRNVLDSFVQNNKTLEEEFPYSRKWGQQIPLHLYNGPLVHYDKINVLSIHVATWWNFKNIYVKWQKPDTKSTTLCNFSYWNPGMDKTKLLWRELVLAWN